MKNRLSILLFSILFLLKQPAASAQDTTKPAAIKQINNTSAQSDKLYGKKIQQQSLSNNHFEKPDTVAAGKTKKKTAKQKRKHS